MKAKTIPSIAENRRSVPRNTRDQSACQLRRGLQASFPSQVNNDDFTNVIVN